jgi:hypothetical protein
MSYVLSDRIEPLNAPRIATRFLDAIDAAKCNFRRTRRVRRRLAARHPFLDLPLQMERQLRFQLALQRVSPEQRTQPVTSFTPESFQHRTSPTSGHPQHQRDRRRQPVPRHRLLLRPLSPAARQRASTSPPFTSTRQDAT